MGPFPAFTVKDYCEIIYISLYILAFTRQQKHTSHSLLMLKTHSAYTVQTGTGWPHPPCRALIHTASSTYSPFALNPA